MPASNPTNNADPINTGASHHAVHGNEIDFADNVLNQGNSAQAITIPKIKDTTLISVDSVRNWLTRFLRIEPTTFRRPTSFARFAERAVDRFTKLIHAITRMNAATEPNNHTNRISPC